MFKGLLTFLLSILIVFSCMAQAPQLIPLPVSIKVNPGHFSLNRQTSIVIPPGDPECKKIADLLAGMLQSPSGYSFMVTTLNKPSNAIHLKLYKTRNPVIGQEGYTLKSTSIGVIITANDDKGLFYGIQTLMQLLPPDIESKEKVAGVNWSLPAIDITDYPRFGWRGLMLM